jgi:hypothetical protein
VAQAEKVTRFANWASLKINQTKTTVTGALHETDKLHPYDESQIKRRLQGVKIQGKQVTVIGPRTPFKFLGVWIRMDMDWGKQFQTARDMLKTTVTLLRRSYVSTSQKMRLLNSCTRRQLAYPMQVAPYSELQLKALDAYLTMAAKAAYGLTRGTGTAFAKQDVQQGGLGCPSIAVEYHTTQIQSLTRALNDPTRLGVLTRALTQQQCHAAVHSPYTHFLYTTSMRLRQYKAAKDSEVEIYKQHSLPLHIQFHGGLAEQLVQLQNEVHKRGKTKIVPAQVHRSLEMLAELGLRHVGELMTMTTGVMHPASFLTKYFPRNAVKPKHKKAVNTLTHYICNGHSQDDLDKIKGKDIPKEERTIKMDTSTKQTLVIQFGKPSTQPNVPDCWAHATAKAPMQGREENFARRYSRS